MLHFKPISESGFKDYWKYSIKSWKKDMNRAGLIDKDISFEQAEKQVYRFIPKGMQTPGHHFLNIYDGDIRIGNIWLEIREREVIEAYIWDLVIYEQYRGKGYGKQTMELVESFVVERGGVRISLNVFPFNEVARNLYAKVGYRDAAITMVKDV